MCFLLLVLTAVVGHVYSFAAWYWKSMSHMKDKLVPALADSDDLEFSISQMKKEVLQMYGDGLQGTKRRRMSILASASVDGVSQLSEAVAKVINKSSSAVRKGHLFNSNRRKSSMRRRSSAQLLYSSEMPQSNKLDFATKLLIRDNGEEAAMQWLQELVRAKHDELKPTETLWSPYTISCWWFEVYLLFSKLCLTSMPLLTRRWIPGLKVEALFAAAITIGPVMFLARRGPYINERDSRTMTLSQGLLAIIIACGTGSTETSAGSSAHQAFVIVIIFGLAIPGTMFMAYSVVDPDLSWARQRWENRCARQTNSSAAVHPLEREQIGGEPADTECGQMKVGEQEEEEEEREQGGPEGTGITDVDSADEVTCIVSLGMRIQEGTSEDEQDTRREDTSTK
jgi:hypothetical protein